jgi:hypothetical protein
MLHCCRNYVTPTPDCLLPPHTSHPYMCCRTLCKCKYQSVICAKRAMTRCGHIAHRWCITPCRINNSQCDACAIEDASSRYSVGEKYKEGRLKRGCDGKSQAIRLGLVPTPPCHRSTRVPAEAPGRTVLFVKSWSMHQHACNQAMVFSNQAVPPHMRLQVGEMLRNVSPDFIMRAATAASHQRCSLWRHCFVRRHYVLLRPEQDVRCHALR